MFEHSVDICVIEDDDAQRALLCEALKRADYSVIDAPNGPAGLQLIYQQRPRVLICDVVLPVLNGIQVCRQIRADPTLDGLYVLLATAHDEGTRKHLALNAGADDYIPKPIHLDELNARIRNGMRYHRLHARLQHAALSDGLTGLWNHTQFRRALDLEYARTRRYGGVLALLMLDIDHFKAINDTYGHEVGNEILRLTGEALTRTVRATDIVARYGGEEFAIICPQTTADEAALLADRLRLALPAQVRTSSTPNLIVRASLGVASTEDPRASSVNSLVSLGDQALYHSKRSGRDRVTRSDALGDNLPHVEVCTDEVDRLRKEIVSLSIKTKEICLQSVWALIQALEARDGYSAWHSRNVRAYSEALVEAAGWCPALKAAAVNAAMLHDLGKIGVPDGLLLKPRPLDPNEWAVLRQVPLITCRILEPLRVFETEIQMIRHIRERFDGAGYPDGLSGNEIPIGSRLIAVAEAFDSLTCNRAYRPGCSIDEAVEVIEREAGAQFDPQFTKLLADAIAQHRDRWEARIHLARENGPVLAAQNMFD